MSKVINFNGVNVTVSEENMTNYIKEFKLNSLTQDRLERNVTELYSMALTMVDVMLPPSMMIEAIAVRNSGEFVLISGTRKIPYIQVVADGLGFKVRERDNSFLVAPYSEDFLSENPIYCAIIRLGDVNANSGI